MFAMLAAVATVSAQSNIVTAAPATRLMVKRGEVTAHKLSFRLLDGYHVNSDKPTDEYMIPMKLTWDAAPLTVAGIDFPAPKLEKYEFSEKPIAVLTGDFDITTRFKAPTNAPSGPNLATAKLRYQACNNRMCFAPKTVEVRVTVDIR